MAVSVSPISVFSLTKCRRRSRRLAIPLIILLTQSTLADSEPVKSIQMASSGIEIGEDVTWLDDNRIVFTGYQRQPRIPTSIYLWEIPDRITLLFESARGYCFDGETLYATRKTPKGHERFLVRESGLARVRPVYTTPASGPIYWDRYMCMRRTIPSLLVGRTWSRLKPGDGYLDFGPVNGFDEPIRVRLLSEDGRSRRDINWVLAQPMLPAVMPVRHRDAYLVYDANLRPAERKMWRDQGRKAIWLVSASGRVEELSVTVGPWLTNGGSILFALVRPGALVISQGFDPDGTPGAAGAYLVRPDGRSQRLASGLVDSPAVSPDGCRVAYAFQSHMGPGPSKRGETPTRSLTITDLCSKGK